jgi:acyl-CoA synthetase (AMP-forming)/AMP-acid ligase II
MPPIPARTLLDLLAQRAVLTPRQSAFFWDDQPFTFEWLWQGVNRFAAQLLHLGVAAGDRVLISLPNGPDFFLAFYGAQRAGAIAVPLFPRSGAARIADIAQLCAAKILVIADGRGEDHAGLRTLSVAGRTDGPQPAAFPGIQPDDIAFLQYTSGSTGAPKGVMLSQRGLLTNVEQLIAGLQLSAADCFVSWLPVYHDMGLILMTMAPFFLGAKLVLLPTSLANARPWLGAIERHRGTVTAAPDFAYRLALRSVRDPAAYNLSSLRVALNAAEPVRSSTIEGFERAFGLHNVVIAGYGLAEATVGVSSWQPGAPPLVDSRGVVSVGHPFPHIDVSIVADGKPLPPGQIGEIVVASPANTRGYFSDPEETARLFWKHPASDRTYIRTGDLGYLDDLGRLFVTGRLKNIIKHCGETIFPQEAEHIADLLPFVRRCAAVGIDSGGPEGEQLWLFAELSRPGGYSESDCYDAAVEVVQAIQAQLGIRPGRVYLMRPHSIPLTYNGKIRHAELRDLFQSGALRASHAILFPDY